MLNVGKKLASVLQEHKKFRAQTRTDHARVEDARYARRFLFRAHLALYLFNAPVTQVPRNKPEYQAFSLQNRKTVSASDEKKIPPSVEKPVEGRLKV